MKESKSVKPDVSRNNKKLIPASNTAAKGSKLNETLPGKRNTSVSASGTVKRPKSQAPEKEEKLEKIKEKPDNKIPKPTPVITKSATSKPLNTIKKIVTKPELKDAKEKEGKDNKDNKSKDLKESKDRAKPNKGGSLKNAPIVSKPKTPATSNSNIKKEEKVNEKEKVTARFETETNEFKTEHELLSNNANVDVDEVIVTNANNEIELKEEDHKEDFKKDVDVIENADESTIIHQEQEIKNEEKNISNEYENKEHNEQPITLVSSNIDALPSEQENIESISLPLIEKKSKELKQEEAMEHNHTNEIDDSNQVNQEKEETVEDKEAFVNNEEAIKSNEEIHHEAAHSINKDNDEEKINFVAKEQEQLHNKSIEQEEILNENNAYNDEVNKEDNSANNNQELQQESNTNVQIQIESNNDSEEKKEQEIENPLLQSANTESKDQEPEIIDPAVKETEHENKQSQEANLDSNDESQSLSNNLQ